MVTYPVLLLGQPVFLGHGAHGPVLDENPLPEETVEVGSVSFTHLRAHETQANLVCRLLLAKKK